MTTNALGTTRIRQDQGERTPRVAVLCHVYNGERYLDEMIQSVLTQTFTEFEFLSFSTTDRRTERRRSSVNTNKTGGSDMSIRTTSADRDMRFIRF